MIEHDLRSMSEKTPVCASQTKRREAYAIYSERRNHLPTLITHTTAPSFKGKLSLFSYLTCRHSNYLKIYLQKKPPTTRSPRSAEQKKKRTLPPSPSSQPPAAGGHGSQIGIGPGISDALWRAVADSRRHREEGHDVARPMKRLKTRLADCAVKRRR